MKKIVSKKDLRNPKDGSIKEKNDVVYFMYIQPALPPNERHKIEQSLEILGYEVHGGGTMIDMSECDISFVRK